MQAIVAVGGRRAGVERHDRLRGERPAQLRVDALGLHRLRVEGTLGGEPGLTLGSQALRLLTPRGRERPSAVSRHGIQQSLAGEARIRLDPTAAG
jgi:hypothetical protein